MATASYPISPDSFTGAGVTGLRPLAFNKQLQEESVLGSIFNKLTGMVTVDHNQAHIDQLPEGSILLEIESSLGGKIPTNVTIGMRRPYHEAPRIGPTENILQYEEKATWRFFTARYNEWKKGVTDFGWGIYHNEQEFYDNLKRVTPGMINYFAELNDVRTQEALVLRFDKGLTKAPHSLTQQFNPNIWVPYTGSTGTDNPKVPTYDSDAVGTLSEGTLPTGDTFSNCNYTEYIGDALYAATNSGANSEYCRMLMTQLLQLDYYARQTKKIPTVKAGGRNCRILIVPSSVGTEMKNPSITGSVAEVLKYSLSGVAGANKGVLEFPGLLGMVGDLMIIEQERFPTLTLGGTDAAWTLTPGFMWPGNSDGRNTSAWSNTSGSLNYVFHLGYLLGANAMVKFVANKLRYNLKQMNEYEQTVGQAAFECSGYQIPIFDVDTKTDSTVYQNSSILIPFAAPDVGHTAVT